jgi:hypothetical protein
MRSRPKGNIQVRCAPSAEDYQVGSQPRRLHIRPMPRLIRIEGTMRLATTK